ncbi:hypothetical protein [uncultured Paracoccus sp.]|uniref:hypothetical protein n=1 Tax=uncultured Paracoccus sp. TaxID=189685 RepID=UPI002608A389|nr:hypothetical protein [uncultured Paracoccus sp.]
MSEHPVAAVAAHSKIAALQPHSGQSDADVNRWFRNKYPGGLTNKSPGAYAAELYKSKPNRDDYSAADWEDVYTGWYESLTDLQKKILGIPKRNRQNDPERKAKEKAKRARNPEYQRELAEKRQIYAATKSDPVRPYRRSVKVTAEQRRAERKDRNDIARQNIRDALASGRNPFTNEDPQSFKWLIADRLLREGSFNMAAEELSEHAVDVRRAYEALRVAKAVSRKGDTITLRPEIVATRVATDVMPEEDEMDLLKRNPFYQMFG